MSASCYLNIADGRLREPAVPFRSENQQTSTCGERNSSMRPIPAMMWLVMKVTCIFYPTHLTGKRRCFRCQVERCKQLYLISGRSVEANDYFPECYDPSGQGYDSMDESPSLREHLQSHTCLLCDSYWWNHNGDICKYSDKNTGVGRWNHRGSWLISITVLFVITCMNIYEFVRFVQFNKGKSNSFVFALSYFILLIELSFYPVVSMYSKFRSSSQCNVSRATWSTTLNTRFIVKRLQFIDFERKGIPGKMLLFLCFAWPLELLAHRILIYSEIGCKSMHIELSFERFQSLTCTFVLMTMWANFQYLLFLCRVSFLRQFQLVRLFINKHQRDLDVCRQVIWSVVYDFNCYRKLVYIYMMMLLPFSSWAVTTTVCMHYKNENYPCKSVFPMIWSQVVMFLGLSLSATGGLDATYMWDQFRQEVLITAQNHNNSRFWQKIVHHMDHLCCEASSVRWTMVLSFISSFVAINSSEVKF